MYQFLGFVLAVLLFSSCEKDVNFNLPSSISEKVVVEGSIEVGTPPFVLLTNSFGFFSKIDFSKLQDAFLSGAQITVSDGARTITLREYSIDTLGNAYKFYTVDTANIADLTFLGVAGKTYNLKIVYDGKTYESTTTIPQAVGIDSMWSGPIDGLTGQDTIYKKVIVRYQDPAALGNKFRYFVKQNDRQFIAPTFSTFDDDIINGTTQDFDIYNVVNPMDTAPQIGSFGFLAGDSVTVKMSAIDAVTFDFWQTLDFSVSTTGNPFSTPIKVPSNISNGALGIWGGYAPSYKSVIVE